MFDLEAPPAKDRLSAPAHLTNIVCWSRMQTEAGQGLEAIVNRKELERRANGGVFFWGVGNPPAKSVREVVRSGERVDAVFSVMKSKPKPSDVSPSRVVLWRSYFDTSGSEKPLPSGTLITSRGESATRAKSAHYALMCYSQDALELGDLGPFDPDAYCNLSAERGPVGASQVTALVERHSRERSTTGYRVNLRAQMTGSFWVRLGSPVTLSIGSRERLDNAAKLVRSAEEWIALVEDLKAGAEPLVVYDRHQPSLL